MEWLRDVFVGPKLQSLDTIILTLLGRKDQDQDILRLRIRLDLATDLHARDPGHHQIQDHQVGLQPRDLLQGGGGVEDAVDRVPTLRKFLGDQTMDGRVVVNDQDLPG